MDEWRLTITNGDGETIFEDFYAVDGDLSENENIDASLEQAQINAPPV
jgi:hypothetical protein